MRKEKEGLKPTKHKKDTGGKKTAGRKKTKFENGTEVCRKKERVMIKTYGKQRRKDADILTSIFYIFTLSRI